MSVTRKPPRRTATAQAVLEAARDHGAWSRLDAGERATARRLQEAGVLEIGERIAGEAREFHLTGRGREVLAGWSALSAWVDHRQLGLPVTDPEELADRLVCSASWFERSPQSAAVTTSARSVAPLLREAAAMLRSLAGRNSDLEGAVRALVSRLDVSRPAGVASGSPSL